MTGKTITMDILWVAIFTLFLPVWLLELHAEERTIVSLKEFISTEVRSQGFTLPASLRVHIYARGGGVSDEDSWDDSDKLYAYGWIIDAMTRKVVWEMNFEDSRREGNYRISDQYLELPKGSYEAYFCNYGYYVDAAVTKSRMNIDRRQLDDEYGKKRTKNRWSWFFHLFGIDDRSWRKDWEQEARNFGMEIYGQSSDVQTIQNFATPLQPPNIVVSITDIGDGIHRDKAFHLSKPLQLRLYAIGEGREHGEMFDYAWIIEAQSRKRVWEMTADRCEYAGGAAKNLKIDEKLTLPAGDYVVSFVTDDSHSPADWNSSPPSDPSMYGITISAIRDADKNAASVIEFKENRNIIAQLIRVHDEQTLSAGFILQSEEHIRIYAIGERSNSNESMADYAWIINTRDRQKVWTMESKRTYHAGGASKNRMIDEVITLPKGRYILYYTTDDSHAYGEWNDDPPNDPEHYGVTIFGKGDWFDPSASGREDRGAGSTTETGSSVLAQLTQVRDDESRTASFTLQKPTRVRIYALGEADDHELVDYGWIENAANGKVVWEMTYSMTTHAGGAEKNRMVNTTMFLDKGEYRVHYKTDGSHSFNDWNDDPPDDIESWGITITRE
jgi:hypothetical protein